MLAQEARKIADIKDKFNKTLDERIDTVLTLIKIAAEKGDYELDFEVEQLNTKQYRLFRKYLKSLGYKVSFFRWIDIYNRYGTTISWK